MIFAILILVLYMIILGHIINTAGLEPHSTEASIIGICVILVFLLGIFFAKGVI